ncbi:MAG: hypothetical protein FWD06_02815 [Oscillospiraceae bacterium]|nr:hypothetical protein [Oscillospiraceae bacterium]
MQPNNLFQAPQGGDLHGFQTENKVRKRKRRRVVVNVLVALVLGSLALSVGFVAMEAMLQVSETPLQPPTEAILQDDNDELPPPEPEQPQLPELEPTWEPMRSFYVPMHMMNDRYQSAQLQQQAAALQTNMAVMTFKCANGWLTYRSTLGQGNVNARHRTNWTLFDMVRRSRQRVVAVVHTYNAYTSERTPQANMLAIIREISRFGEYNATVSYILLRDLDIDDTDFIVQAQDVAGEVTIIPMLTRVQALATDWWDIVEFIAVDTRDTDDDLHEYFWRSRPAIPVVATPQQELRDYIVLIDEVQ